MIAPLPPYWATPRQRIVLSLACRILRHPVMTDREWAAMTYAEAEALLDQYRREYQQRQRQTKEGGAA